MAFLVRPGGSLDAEPAASRVRGKGPSQLKRVDHPERAVEPAAIRLGLAVRADQEPPLGRGIAADNVAYAVDHRVEPGLAQLPSQPMPRLDVDRRIGRPVHTGFVAAKFCELLEVGDDALSVDGRHLHISFGPVECCHCDPRTAALRAFRGETIWRSRLRCRPASRNDPERSAR